MVPLAAVPETIVDARDAAVPSAVKPAAMKSAISGMEAAAMEATTSVKTAAPAMRAGIGEVRLAERSSEQQNSCSSSQGPS
jgi:hypothetical protein